MLLMLALLGVMLVQTAQAFYNPSTGRWLSRDPIEEKGGRNIYCFVNNTTTLTFDTDGRQLFPGICSCGSVALPRHVCTQRPDDDGDEFDADAAPELPLSAPWKICCRPVRGLVGLLFVHCDHRQGPCDSDPGGTSYPITRDPNCCANKDIKDDLDMSKCLRENSNDAGGGSQGNNCQTSSSETLRKCCAKSDWQPHWYAYPVGPADCAPGY